MNIVPHHSMRPHFAPCGASLTFFRLKRKIWEKEKRRSNKAFNEKNLTELLLKLFLLKNKKFPVIIHFDKRE